MSNPLLTVEDCKQLLDSTNPWLTLLIGTFFGWFFTRGISYLSRPNLQIVLGGESIFKDSQQEIKFLHVDVINKKRGRIRRFLLGNESAVNARAWVTFLDPITNIELIRINGRWTTTKEPVNYETHKPDIALALIPPREIIPAGENSTIAIALKVKSEESAYAFNNESYLYAWKKTDYELTDKQYYIKVKVTAEGYEWNKRFILLNKGKSISHFKLA